MRELEGRRCAADGVECEANTTATDTETLRRPSQLGLRPVAHLRLLSSTNDIMALHVPRAKRAGRHALPSTRRMGFLLVIIRARIMLRRVLLRRPSFSSFSRLGMTYWSCYNIKSTSSRHQQSSSHAKCPLNAMKATLAMQCVQTCRNQTLKYNQ